MATTWGMQCVGSDRPQADLYQVTEIADTTQTDILAFTMPPNSMAVLSCRFLALSSMGLSSYVGCHYLFTRMGTSPPTYISTPGSEMWPAVEGAGLAGFAYPSGGDVVLRFTADAAAVATTNNVRTVAHGSLVIIEKPDLGV